MKTARRFREPASALALVLLVAAAGCADSAGSAGSAAPSRRATDDSADFDRSGTHHVKTVNVTFDANPLSRKSSTMAHAVAKDASGRVLTDKSVTWRSQNQNVAMVSRDGLVTPQRQGTSTIQATIEGVTGDAPLSVIDSLPVGTDSVTALSITRQPSAAAQSGVAFAVQPVIQLRGVLNTPVRRAGVVVSAAVASGDGMVMGTTSATTNSDGVATFTGLGIRGPVGSYTVRFSASGASVTSDAIALSAGPASQLAITTQPSATAASGSAFARQPVVQAQDDVGNPASQSGVVVSVALASGTGTLGGPVTATTNASGVASFTGLSITGSGAYTLRFSASGLTGATSSTITVTQTAAALVVQTQPGGATSGTPFTQQPVVRIVDNAGQVVSGSTLAVTAAVTSGSGTLSGTTTVSAVNGVATFTNLQINGAGTDVLTFSTTNPALQVASNSFTVAAATPVATQLVITRQPAGATSGSAFTTQPVVEVRDGNNARVSSSTAAVTAAVASGSGTLSGTTTVSAVNGVATFTNLTISGSGTYTLVFRSTGLTSATSSSFTVASSPPPPPSGSPMPDANDVILLDLRSSLQQQTNVDSALELFLPQDPSHADYSTPRTGKGEGWSFSTNVDGRGTHALICNYVAGAGDHGCYARQQFTSGQSEFYIQWKGRYGRMATDPTANGAVDAFDWDPNYGFKRVLVTRPSYHNRLDFDGSMPDLDPHIEDAEKNWIRSGTLTGWTFRTPIGHGPFTSTIYHKVASSATAADGIFRLWIDGTLVYERTDVPSGNELFSQWQIFATWPSVPQAQSEYLWDVLVWRPVP